MQKEQVLTNSESTKEVLENNGTTGTLETGQIVNSLSTRKSGRRVRVKDLDYLLHKLIGKYSPLQVFCFHKHIERKDTAGCFTENSEEVLCNYYLLMVTESPLRIEHAVQDFANAHFNQGAVIVLVHGKESIER